MKYLTAKKAAEILDVSQQRLANLRHLGSGPPYSKMGTSIRYNEADLEKYMEKLRVVPPGTRSNTTTEEQ